MSNSSQFASGSIKSIQRGEIAIPISAASASVTISAVNVNKSNLSKLGENFTGATPSPIHTGILTFINGTTITAKRGSAPGDCVTTVAYQVVETY